MTEGPTGSADDWLPEVPEPKPVRRPRTRKPELRKGAVRKAPTNKARTASSKTREGAQPPQDPVKLHGSSTYTPEIADRIVEEIAAGESVREICKQAWAPNQRTVFGWLSRHPEFAQQYARAREVQQDAILEKMTAIADEAPLTKEGVAKARLKIDNLKWQAAKLNPKKYGDRINIDAQVTVATLPLEALEAKFKDVTSRIGSQVPDMLALGLIEDPEDDDDQDEV